MGLFKEIIEIMVY